MERHAGTGHGANAVVELAEVEAGWIELVGGRRPRWVS